MKLRKVTHCDHAVDRGARRWKLAEPGINSAVATNGTLAYPLPRNDASGNTQIHINGANVVVTQSGSHDWTNYEFNIFFWYTES